jgi:integrase/recombinase XerD
MVAIIQSLSLSNCQSEYETVFLPARNLAPRSRMEYGRDIADVVGFLTSECHLSAPIDIDKHHLDLYLAELDRRAYRGETRRRRVVAIRSFCSFLVERGYVPLNPSDRLVHPVTEQREPRLLSKAEYQRLQLAAAQSPRSSAVRDAALIEVLLQTGIRLFEAATLLLSDIQLPQRISPEPDNVGSLRVFGKGRKERTIAVNYKACKALKAYLAVRPVSADQHVFLTKYRTGMKRRAIQTMVEKYLSAANIYGASVHTLRHTFGTHMVKQGAKLPIVRDVMGHASTRRTELYVHLARAEQSEAVQTYAL